MPKYGFPWKNNNKRNKGDTVQKQNTVQKQQLKFLSRLPFFWGTTSREEREREREIYTSGLLSVLEKHLWDFLKLEKDFLYSSKSR